MRWISLALPIALAASAVDAKPARGPVPGGGCMAVVVSSADAPQTRTDRPPVFSATAVEDLQLTVVFKEGREQSIRPDDDTRIVELRVFTPHGRLYQSMKVPFAAAEVASVRRAQAVPGYPRPVAVQSLRPVAGLRESDVEGVGAALPVAGTSIVTSSIYGDWRVEAYLDGEQRSCAQPAVFTIQP